VDHVLLTIEMSFVQTAVNDRDRKPKMRTKTMSGAAVVPKPQAKAHAAALPKQDRAMTKRIGRWSLR
jgi:hypothetical protein